MSLDEFQLVLFSVDEGFVQEAEAAGVSCVLVDWEWREKRSRQEGCDTQVNRHSVKDLARIRECFGVGR